jgi:succinyl-CoA synthetase alpha subunit
MIARAGVRPRHVQYGSGRCRRALSSSPAYDSTLSHLHIGADTRVIFQGFTGRLATANARESLAWGTRIVGGVKPGVVDGAQEHLGLPVFPSVRAAAAALRPDASAVYVAAPQAGAAIEEAIEAEVPLIVAVAEHIPLHDMLRVRLLPLNAARALLSS